MSSSQQRMKQLRQKIVSTVKQDEAVQETQVTDQHCVTMPLRSKGLADERDSKKGAECVEGGSIAWRSGAVQHSRLHPLHNPDILSDDLFYPFCMNLSGRKVPKNEEQTQINSVSRKNKTVLS